MTLRLLSLVVLFALPAQVLAEAPAKPRRVKIAVLDVRAVGAFDPKTVQGLSTFIASEAGSYPFKIIAGTDLSTLIGFERQKQLLGCSDSSCLAEIGGALGVDYLLSTEVSQVGGIWLISATVLDVGHSSALKRVTKRTEQAKDLIDVAQAVTHEALDVINAPTDVPKAQPKTQLKAEPVPAAATTATADSSMSGVRVAGIGLAAGGAAALIGGVICDVLSGSSYDTAKTASDPAKFASAKSDGQNQALIADILYVGGGVLAATGVILAIVGGNSPAAPTTPAVTLAPISGGGALVVSGGF